MWRKMGGRDRGWNPGSGPEGRPGRGREGKGEGQAHPPLPAPGLAECRRGAEGGGRLGDAAVREGPS